MQSMVQQILRQRQPTTAAIRQSATRAHFCSVLASVSCWSATISSCCSSSLSRRRFSTFRSVCKPNSDSNGTSHSKTHTIAQLRQLKRTAAPGFSSGGCVSKKRISRSTVHTRPRVSPIYNGSKQSRRMRSAHSPITQQVQHTLVTSCSFFDWTHTRTAHTSDKHVHE
jgi:hypothetical protein